MWRLEPEGEKETAETRVVSDEVEGVSAYPDGGAGLNGGVPQPLEETVEAETLVPRERVRQLTAEQIGGAPQFREETVGFEIPEPQMVVQLVEVPKIVVGLSVFWWRWVFWAWKERHDRRRRCSS